MSSSTARKYQRYSIDIDIDIDIDDDIINTEGYINVTDFCRSMGKNIKDWMSEDYSKKLIDELSKKKYSLRNPVVKVTTGPTKFRGIYVSPLLFTHIASWCDPEYAITVSKIVNNSHIADEELTKKDTKIIIEQQKYIIKKINSIDRKIDTLLLIDD